MMYMKPFWLVSAVMLAVFSFIYLPVGTAPAVSHDFLDSIYGFYVLWGRHSDSLFVLDYVVPELSGGLPINVLAMSEFGGAETIFRIFDPWNSYVILVFIQWVTAFIGLYLLLKDHVFDQGSLVWVALALAATFALVPHKPSRVLVEVGIPLVIWSFLNVSKSKNIFISYLLLAFYAIFAPFHYGGYAVCGYALLYCVYIFIVNRESFFRVLFGFLIIVLSYFLILYRMFYHWFFDGSYHSIRHIMKSFDYENFPSIYQIFIRIFDATIYYPGSHHLVFGIQYISILVWVSFVCYILLKLYPDRRFIFREFFVVCFIMSLVFIGGIINIVDQTFNPMESIFGFPFPLHRMDVVSVPILLVALSLIVRDLNNSMAGRCSSALRSIILMLPCVVLLVSSSGFREKVKWAFGAPSNVSLSAILASTLRGEGYPAGSIKPQSVNGRHREFEISLLSDYFETKAFQKIVPDLVYALQKEVGEITTISFGLAPSVSWFHGFKSLDGRYYDASIGAKKVMDQIFDAELRKDGRESAMVMTYVSDVSVHDGGISPDIDVCNFTKVGGGAIMSLYPILNAEELRLRFLGAYSGSQDPILVYFVLDGCGKN